MIWKDSYSVGSLVLDRQHRRLFDLLNDLHGAIELGVDREQLQNLLRMLERYSLIHFEDEEQVMAAVKYPQLTAHRADHLAFKLKVARFRDQLLKGELDAAVVLDFMKEWLLEHILKADQKFAPFIIAAEDAPSPPAG